MEIENTNDVKVQHIKVLVHGGAGSGKTRLCATTGGNALVLSVEGGLLSLRGLGIDFVRIKDMEDLRKAYEDLLTDTKYDWVCLDSISEIAEVVLSAEKKKTNDPRKAYGEMQDVMMGLMRSFRDLPKNIYFSAKQEKTKDETTGGMIYSPSAPGQKLGQAMPYLFDLVFAAHTWKDSEGKEHFALQTHRDAQYEAKDRSGCLDMVEQPDLSAIYKKIINQPSNTKGE